MNKLTSMALGLALSIVASLPAVASEKYVIDTEGGHYYAGFQISHLGFSIMHGRFDKISGTIDYNADNPIASNVSVTIESGSINTNHAQRDAHLKSPDFFNAEEFPKISFVSTSVEKTGENVGKVTGNLTILGVTKSVVLDTRLINVGANPFSKKGTAAWSARGKIKRSDFGIKYGLPVIGDEITLLLDVEALKQ
ncbi:MAG: polyisoprenoid-binding protein [Alphaproteobacteria bacterium]|jgi:polyisoprenoid-binding protein YceI|nr:polyisoprenoid-binding protein [Alphaproteobacteria bacterium]MBT4084388.1 polyisoprenoid-binding protein [Alphaproteobacteria bacterium]MBT4545610.1 polyisoprenoid-binding protein [Alphaproteobacteria bacterium]MBT7748067.1 polyisoprenoid-binding protein [Alphaproteobacteria bacterium]